MRNIIALTAILMIFVISTVSWCNDVDRELRAKWSALTSYLKQGENQKALELMHPAARSEYAKIFEVLGDKLPQVTSTQVDFRLISISDDYAKYELITDENGKRYSYEVIFEKWQDGKWYIRDY